jgi:transcriptional regulator with XRE-family HTH domain
MAQRQWNAYDLERYSGITQPTIWHILNGKTASPQQKSLLPIAHALGLTEAQIRGLQPIPGYTSGNLGEDAAAYGEHALPPPLTPKQKAMLALSGLSAVYF